MKVTSARRVFFLSLLFFAFGVTSLVAHAYEGWTDVHFHIVGNAGSPQGFADVAESAIEVMNEAGMGKVLILPPPRPFESYDIEELQAVQKRYPDRIAMLGGGGTLNPMLQEWGQQSDVPDNIRQAFEKRAEEIVVKGAVGFGEITTHHVSLNPGHAYEWIPPDHTLMLLLADIAAKHNVVIDLHMDPVPETGPTPDELSSGKNPDNLRENVKAFERLLSHNRKAKIVWAHAGSDPVGYYTPELVSRLMQKHPNLYCSIRTTFRRNNPMRTPRFGVNDEWVDVLKAFPDRFVMGTDSFVLTDDYSGPNGPRVFERRTHIQREGANEVLDYLDNDLARKIGYENARRIYGLKE